MTEKYYDDVYTGVLAYCADRREVSEAEVQYECGLSYDTVKKCFARMLVEKCVEKNESEKYVVRRKDFFAPDEVRARMEALVTSLDGECRTELAVRLGVSRLGERALAMRYRYQKTAFAADKLKKLHVLTEAGCNLETTLTDDERAAAIKVLVDTGDADIRGAALTFDRNRTGFTFGSDAVDEKKAEAYRSEDAEEENDKFDLFDDDDEEDDDDEFDLFDDDDEEDDDDEDGSVDDEESESEDDEDDENSVDDDSFKPVSEYFEKRLERFKRNLDEGKCDLFGSVDDDKDELPSALINLLIRKRRETVLKKFDENLAAAGIVSDDCLQAKKRSEQISAEIREILNDSDASRHTADSEGTFLYKSLSDMTAVYKKLVSDIRETIERDKRSVWEADSEEFRMRRLYAGLGEQIIYIATKALPSEKELRKEALSSGSADDYARRFADKVACMVLAYMNDYAYVRKGYKRFDDIFVYYKTLYVLFNSAFVWEFSPEGKEAGESSELFKSLKASISEAASRAGIDFYEDTFSCDGELLRRFNSRVYRDVFRFTVEMFAEEAAKKALMRLINDDGEGD